MTELEGEIIVGILGQWASGKSTAAGILVRYLGGEGKVVFINDRVLYHQNRLEEQGTIIERIPNDHDDIERFRADIIAAFEEMFRDALPARTVDGN
jgi:uridine kinase